MPRAIFQPKHGFVRIYDGSSPRNFVHLALFDQPTLPLAPPRPTTGVQTDAGRMTDDAATYIEDETVPFMPIDVSLRVIMQPEHLEMLDSFGNVLNKASWVIGGDTWTGLALNALGTRLNSEGVAVDCLYPQDVPQQSRLVSVVRRLSVPADAPTGTPFITEYKGISFTTPQLVAEANMYYAEFTGQLWGTIDNTLTDWPANGNESIPS